MLKKIMKRLIWTTGFGLVLLLGLVLLGNYLLQQPRVQAFIIKGLADATGFAVKYDKLQFSLRTGIGFSMEGFEAQALSGPDKIRAAKVLVRLHTWELLRKQIRPTRIYLYQSRLETVWPEQVAVAEAGDPFLVRIPSLKWLARLQDLDLEQSEIFFTNRTFALTQLELRVHQRKADPLVLLVASSGRVKASEQAVPFKLAGTLSQDFRRGASPALDMTLELKQYPLAWIPMPEFLALKSGQMDCRLKVKGRPEDQLNLEGWAQISAMDLAWVRRRRSKPFPFANWSMNFKALIQGRSFRVPELTLQLPEIPLAIVLNLDFKDNRNPYIESRLSGPWMTLRTFTDLFPSPMLPDWYEKELFPLFKSGQVQAVELKMQGSVAEGSPDRYPDTPGLIVKINCRDMEARVPGAAYPFEAVNARVEIEKQTLKIADFKARFGQCVMQKSGFESKTIFEDNPSFAITLAGTFDVPELAKQLNIEMLQPQVPGQVKEIAAAISTGTLVGRADLRYNTGKLLELRQGEFEFQNWRMNLAKYLLPVEIKTAQIKVEEQKEDQFQVVGSWGHSAIEAQGGFEIRGQAGELKRLHLLSRVDLNEILPMLYPAAKTWKFKGPVPVLADFKRNNKSWSAQGRLDLADFSGENEQLLVAPKPSRLEFDLDLAPGRLLDVKKIFFLTTDGRAETGRSQDRGLVARNALLLKGSYDLQHRYLIACEGNMPALELETLGLRFKEEDKLIKGELGCDLKFKGGQGQATDRMDGWVKGQKIELYSKALPAPIREGQFLGRFSGANVTIPFCRMHLGGSQIQISGGFRHTPLWKGKLLLEADRFNPGDFKLSGSADWPVRNWDPWLEKMDLDLDVQVAKGQWQELKWGPLQADLHLSNQGILIQKAVIQGEHGRLETSGKIRFGAKPELTFSSKIQMADQPVQEILPLLSIDPKDLSGKLNLNGLFYTRAKDSKGLVAGTTGFAELGVKDAVVQHSSALISILDFLSIKKIFKNRPPDVSKEGLYFEDIGSQLTMDRGVIKTENLYLKGPVINVLVPRGEVDLRNKSVSFQILVQPWQVVDGIISHIPIIGYILTGDDKAFIAYQFVMEGPWKTAQPKYKPLKDLDQSVIGFFKRILLTPSRLLNKISNGSKTPLQTNPAPAKDD